MSVNQFLFVYGTLLHGECNHFRLGASSMQAEQVWVNGHLFNTGCGYPALVNASTEDRVFGEVYEVTPEVLKVIDGLEGYNGEGNPANLYERITIKVHGGVAPMDALTYVFKPHRAERLERLQTGDWRIEGV
jgi:gamma-glutamylcyclotransferase (GGCT)/AIG2-like uncharacterized protein YtfP